MKRLFKERISSFTSLVSLIMLAAMLSLFSLFLPNFIVSLSGRIFAIIWAVVAIAAFIAHTRKISERQLPSYSVSRIIDKKVSTSVKYTRQRMMRGM